MKKDRLFVFGGNNEPFNEVFRVKKEDNEGNIKKETILKEGRMMFLFNDMLLLCEPDKKKGKLSVMAKIRLADLRVQDFNKHDPNELKIRDISSEKSPYKWVFLCKNPFNKVNWLEKFESVGVKKKVKKIFFFHFFI